MSVARRNQLLYFVVAVVLGIVAYRGLTKPMADDVTIVQNTVLVAGYTAPPLKSVPAYWQRVCERKTTDNTWSVVSSFCKGKNGQLCPTITKIDESADCVLR